MASYCSQQATGRQPIPIECLSKRQKSTFLSQIFVENFFLRFSIFFDKNLRPDSCHFSFSTKIDFCRKWPGFLSKMKKMKKMKRLFWSRSAQSDFCRNRFLSISVFFIFPDKNPTDKNWSAQTLVESNRGLQYQLITVRGAFQVESGVAEPRTYVEPAEDGTSFLEMARGRRPKLGRSGPWDGSSPSSQHFKDHDMHWS